MNTFQEMAAGSMKLIQKPDPPFYAFCTHCRQQHLDPDMKWIDLAASYDGGVVEVDGLMATVDDVHLCESCATLVGRLIGMNFTEELEKENAKLAKQVNSLTAKLAFAKKELEK